MKIALTAVLTAAACFAFTAATGLASHRSQLADVTLRVGDYVKLPALDLACFYPARDPDHHERGPILSCSRTSDTNPDDKPATLQVSKYHFKIAATGASTWTSTVWRHP